MSVEQKFNAAVNVIRSLPKNGSYQPSNDLMLRFYAYYKQATDGPLLQSNSPKPNFWDVVGRAKYTAWGKLKNMTKDEAMKRYVDELHHIVETMSYTSDVANFLKATEWDQTMKVLPSDDLHLVAGDVLKSPSDSQSHTTDNKDMPNGIISNGINYQDDSEDEEFIDSEDTNIHMALANVNTNGALTNGSVHSSAQKVDISNEISRVVASLQMDLRQIDQRLQSVEKAAAKKRDYFSQLSFRHLSPALLAFLIVWPFVAVRIADRFKRKV